MNISSVQNRSAFCGTLFGVKKKKKQKEKDIKHRPIQPPIQEQSKALETAAAYNRSLVNGRTYISRINLNSMTRFNDIQMRPGTVYFVNDDTKFLLGETMFADLGSKAFQSRLDHMECGESIIIGRNFNFPNICTTNISPRHLKLTKAAKGCYMAADLNSEFGTKILKNITPVKRTKLPFILNENEKYLFDSDAIIRLSSKYECRFKDFDFSQLTKGESVFIYRDQLHDVNSEEIEEGDEKGEALKVTKFDDTRLIVEIADKKYRSAIYWGVEEEDEKDTLRPLIPLRFIEKIEDNNEEPIEPIRIDTTPIAIESQHLYQQNQQDEDNTDVDNPTLETEARTQKHSTQDGSTGFEASTLPDTKDEQNIEERKITTKKDSSKKALENPEDASVLSPNTTAPIKKISYDIKVDDTVYTLRAGYEGKKLKYVAIIANNPKMKRASGQTYCAGRIFPASQVEQIPEVLRQHVKLTLDEE